MQHSALMPGAVQDKTTRYPQGHGCIAGARPGVCLRFTAFQIHAANSEGPCNRFSHATAYRPTSRRDISVALSQAFAQWGGGGGQGGFLVRSLVDGPGSYSVAHRTIERGSFLLS